MHIHALSDVNLDTNNPFLLYAELTQQPEMMGCELTNTRDYQKAASNKYGYSRKDGTSKTITLLSEPTFAVLPCYPTSNKNDTLTSSWEIEAKHDSVQVEKHPHEREILMFDQKVHEFCIYKNASHLNTWGVWQSVSNICADYLQQTFIRADTGIISTMIKFLQNCNNAITWERKCLHTVNIPWHALHAILFNKETPLYSNNLNLFNTSYSWLESDKCQQLETYSAISKKSHIEAACNTNNNSQKHSSTSADCISFNDSSRQASLIEIWEYSDDIKVNHEGSVSFKSHAVPQNDAVTMESRKSTSLDQHSLDRDESELSDIKMQKEIMGTDSVYRLHDITKDSTDETGFGEGPIIKFQELQSLSQPSLPTHWFHDSTDDEPDDGSNTLSETFTEYEDIHHENVRKLLTSVTEGTKGKKHIEKMPHNALNIVSHKTAEEEIMLADPNQKVHTVQSDHLDINTKSNENYCFSELCNKSQKLHLKNDELIFYEETKLSCSSSFDMDIGNNAHRVPLGTTQNSNIWYRDDGNGSEMESEVSQNINGTENHINGREYTRNEKQHPLLSLSNTKMFSVDTVIPDGSAQCKVHILSDIANSWNGVKNTNTCTEQTETKHSHHMLLACNSNYAQDENVQHELCALTLPSGTNTNKREVGVTTSQTHEAQEEICHLTEANSRIHNKYEPYMKTGNMSSPENITQKAQLFTRTVSPDMSSSDLNQHLHQQNKQAILSNSASKSTSDCWEVNYQTHPVPFPCIQNGQSHNQMVQVHNRHPENTLHSYIDMAIKKYENDDHMQSCYTQVKPTRDVAVQTNVRSLNNSWNQNYCFLCFNNYNQFNNNGWKDGNHQNLALKRNIDALYLESLSVHKKPRYGILTSTNLEPDVDELPINHNSESQKSETNEGFFSDYNNESDSEDGELQNITKMDVDSDHKVPDVANDTSWMEDDMNQKELYRRDHIMKGKLKLTSLFATMTLPFSTP
jgi:hypothetical protein